MDSIKREFGHFDFPPVHYERLLFSIVTDRGWIPDCGGSEANCRRVKVIHLDGEEFCSTLIAGMLESKMPMMGDKEEQEEIRMFAEAAERAHRTVREWKEALKKEKGNLKCTCQTCGGEVHIQIKLSDDDSGSQASRSATPILEKGSATPILEKGGATPTLEKGSATPILEEGSATPILEKGNATPILEKGRNDSSDTEQTEIAIKKKKSPEPRNKLGVDDCPPVILTGW